MTMSRKPRNEMSTITATPKNTRAYRRKRCLPNDSIIDEILTTTPKKRTAYGGKQYLPHDLIIEEILTKVPTVALLVSGAVSKAWYYSIHIDKRLTHSHFLRSQKEPNLILNLLNVKVGVTDAGKSKYSSQFFRVANGNFHRLPYYLSHVGKGEMVGYCNGFPCTALAGCYTILNPSRCDYLRIINPAIDGKLISNAHIICHGFGFDSLANTYKLVSIFCTSPNQFNVVVFSLGTKSWRNVTATSALISDGHSIIRLRAGTSSDKSAIYCSSFSSTGSSSSSSSSGCLVWKLITTIVGGEGANTNYENSSVETEMLLSFNLHDEKFQYIKLPTKSVADEKENQFLVDHPHLLEFRGSPCIARLEKRSRIESDYYHRQSHDHQGSSCCCCCKIHLYVLKDKAKWVKEESFDVRMKSTRNSLLVVPDPCCFCVDITPLTRIFSFSNEILLYWFDGEHLQVYNLRSEKLKIVIPQHALERDIFLAKMKEPLHILDYQLHRQGENFLSLQTFVPGVAGIDADSFHKLYSKTDSYSAFVFVHKGSGQYYPF